jgi:hypothetical protein
MRVSRATFLKAFGTAIVGAGVDARTLLASAAGLSNVSAPSSAGPFRLHDARAAIFQPHANTPFAVRSADGARVRMVLAKVAERPITKNVEQFSLIFHAPAGTTLPQGTHAFHHQALGEFDLFIVPVGAPNGRRTVYQACFSRHSTRRRT